ncbi:MAG: chaperone SurA [marine bacterium B5-7]|nr:MAG: chaperone SurA [marine bacterium B5-7]
MRRLIKVVLFLATLAGIVSPVAAQVMDRVLVIVNDGVITESEYIKSMQRTIAEYRARGRGVPERRDLEEQVMEQLILERIQLQMADRAGIKVSDSQVDRAIEDIAVRQGLSAAELKRRAQQSGLDPDEYIDSLRKQLKIQRLIDREIRRRVIVSESEIDDMVTTLSSEAKAENVEYEVAHISLLLDDPGNAAERSEKLEKITEINKLLDSGESFESLARQYSDSPTSADGGNLGWRGARQLPDFFYAAVKNLEAGQTSKVIETSEGFHLVQLVDRRGGGGELVEQWHVRHILFSGGETNDISQAMEDAQLIRERIIRGEDFEELARVHSTDTSTRVKGGDLGWISPGDTSAVFEEAVRNLDIGEISEPVVTRFGVHLIEVLDRRKQDISDKLLRQQAERRLRDQKGREAYDQWLRRIRAEAYVKFRVKPG